MIIETPSLNNGEFDEVKPLRKDFSFKHKENRTNFERSNTLQNPNKDNKTMH